MFLANVLDSVIRGTRRIVQVSLFKKAREIPQALPYGVDSAPVREMVAVYANTADMGNSVIVGYVYRDAVAEVGSIRLYSENGYVHLRANGNLELLGTADNAMRFTAFNTTIQNYLIALNAAITTGVASAGGGYTAPPAPNFTSAKINEIKTL